MALVEVDDLKIFFEGHTGMLSLPKAHREFVHAVDGVGFHIQEGEILSLVGESGCGKSTTGMGILRLVNATAGTVLFRGENVLKMKGRSLRRYRRKAQMIFQSTYASLDPRMTVREIVAEPIRIHALEGDEQRIEEKMLEVLETMGLRKADLEKMPNEFSGGQARRIGIARALVLGPELIVADEPTSGLDVSVAAGILNLMCDLRDKHHLTYLWISHDLHAVSFISDRVAVMYLGKIVEMSRTKHLIENLCHPYTKALFSAIPMLDPAERISRIILKGEIPSALHPPSGCRFHTRCSYRMPRCSEAEPPFKEIGADHWLSCYLYE